MAGVTREAMSLCPGKAEAGALSPGTLLSPSPGAPLPALEAPCGVTAPNLPGSACRRTSRCPQGTARVVQGTS